MKKASVLFSVVLLLAMVLSACSGGGSNNQSGDTGAVTPETTTLATESTDMTATPAVDMSATPEESVTTEATATMEATATLEATATQADTTGSTGDQGQVMSQAWDRFSHYAGLPVQDTAGKTIGTMRGLVIMVNEGETASIPQTGSDTGMNADQTATPEATTDAAAADATATPTAEASTGGSLPVTGSEDAANAAVDRIVYLAVDPDQALFSSGSDAASGDTGSGSDNAGRQVLLIPWTAVNVSGAADTTGTGAGSTVDATATPDAAAATPESSTGTTGGTDSTVAVNGPTAIVISVNADVVATAPLVDEAEVASGRFDTFVGSLSGFWNTQGLSTTRTIPMTGDDTTTGETSTSRQTPLYLTSTNYKNMDVVDLDGNAIGKTDDFIVDTANGMVNYVVFQGQGSSFAAGGKFVAVPLSAVSWNEMGNTGAGNSAANAGPQYQLVVNLPAADWSNAPVFTDWGPNFDLSSGSWNTDLTSFWGQYTVK